MSNDKLDTLRPEVTDDWPATLGEYLKVMSTLEQRFTSGNEVPVPDARITRAEWEVLDRFSLADEARSTDAGMEILRLNDKCDDLKAELAETRETIKRLNRRVQVAEAGVADKVKASGGGFGRSLANAAAAMFMRERDEARADLAALKARIAGAPTRELFKYFTPDELGADVRHLIGKRVRLVVEE